MIYQYDGSKFFGFQRQVNEKTVQGEIEKVFTRNIPIIIHQQEFEETPILWTKKANPTKLIKEFLDYFDGDDE